MKKIFIILFCLLITSPALAATSELFTLWRYFKEGKMVQIPSYNSGPFPNEFMSLKDGSYKNSPVTINALIVFPKKGEEPFPMLVFNHSSGGAPQPPLQNIWHNTSDSCANMRRQRGSHLQGCGALEPRSMRRISRPTHQQNHYFRIASNTGARDDIES